MPTTWRDEIVTALDTGNAFQPWKELVADFPLDRINKQPPHVPYTFWHLLEHIRFCQWEIIEKLERGVPVDATWPDDFWPSQDKKVDAGQWHDTIRKIDADIDRLKAMVRDLLAPAIPDADYTALASIMSVVEHNAYHWGEFAILRQVTGTWGSGHDG